MALTGVNRGTGNHASLVASWTMSPTSDFTSGSYAVLCVVYDNSGSLGADPFLRIVDSKDNLWVSRQDNLYDPGGGSAGVVERIFTTKLNGTFTTSDTVTMTISAAAQSKAWSFIECDSSSSDVLYNTGGKNTGSVDANPTVTTGTIPSGSMVVGSAGSEETNSWVGDADTSNGTWSTHQTDGANAGTGGVGHSSQWKVVSASATQTYNPTHAATDQVLAWIQLDETTDPFPKVRAKSKDRTTTTNTTSHAITLPPSPVAGEVLICVFSVDGNPTVSVDTGASGSNWIKLGQASDSTLVTGAIFYKVAESSDALTLTTSASEQSSHLCYTITGASGVVNGTSSSGASTDSAPASHTPAGGLNDYLWIVTRSGDSTVLATALPSDFGGFYNYAAAGVNGASSTSGDREYTASVLNPSTFISTNENWVCWTLAIEPEAGGDVTYNATVLSSSFSVQTPATSAGASVSPAVLSSTFSVQTPGVSAAVDATFNASVLSSSFSVQAPTTTAGANISPAVLSSPFSVQAPTLTADASTAAGVQSAAFSVESPSIGISASVSPAVLSASFSVEAPSISAGASVSAAVLSSAFSVQAPTTSADANVSPAVQIAAFSLQAPSVAVTQNANFNASALSASFSIQSPGVDAVQSPTVSPGVLSASFSVQSPTVSATENPTVSPGVLSASFGVQAPGLTADASTAAGVQVASFSVQPPSVTAGGSANFNAAVLSASFSVQAPAVSAEVNATVSPAVLSAAFGVQTPATSAGAAVSAAVQSAAFTLQSPAISATQDATFNAPALSASFGVQSPTASTSATVSPAVLEIISAINAPVVTADANFFASVLTCQAVLNLSIASGLNAQYLLLEGDDFLQANNGALRL